MKIKSNAVLIVVALLAYWAGLCNASAFYDPGTQRWVNRDPIEEYGGINLFKFVKNNPTIFFDPYGDSIEWVSHGLEWFHNFLHSIHISLCINAVNKMYNDCMKNKPKSCPLNTNNSPNPNEEAAYQVVQEAQSNMENMHNCAVSKEMSDMFKHCLTVGIM